MNRLCVLVVGNPSDGFRFIGPFADFDAATQFGEGVDADNWVATLEAADLPTAFVTAAAPELLLVCKSIAGDLQALLDGDDFSGMSDAEMFGVMLRSLNAAIATAEGRGE